MYTQIQAGISAEIYALIQRKFILSLLQDNQGNRKWFVLKNCDRFYFFLLRNRNIKQEYYMH